MLDGCHIDNFKVGHHLYRWKHGKRIYKNLAPSSFSVASIMALRQLFHADWRPRVAEVENLKKKIERR